LSTRSGQGRTAASSRSGGSERTSCAARAVLSVSVRQARRTCRREKTCAGSVGVGEEEERMRACAAAAAAAR
jgi:hypothetical protein